MLQSQLTNFIRKEFPKDEEAINAKVLIRAGFVDKLMAGVYSYLPLGLKVLKKNRDNSKRRDGLNRCSGSFDAGSDT